MPSMGNKHFCNGNTNGPIICQSFYEQSGNLPPLNLCINTVSVWWHYIDDIFALWPHEEGHLRQFIEEINQVHSAIKFTAKWSDESMTFLDNGFVVTCRCCPECWTNNNAGGLWLPDE